MLARRCHPLAITRLCGVLLALCLAVVPAAGERRESLTLDTSVTLAGVGLKLRPFRDFRMVPAPNADMTVYVHPDTNEKVEAFNPADLWVQAQLEGVFKGPAGAFFVASLRFPVSVVNGLPRFPGGQVRRADFDKAAAAATADWAPADIRVWVTALAGKGISGEQDKVAGVSLPFPYVRFSFAGRDSRFQAWLLQIPRGSRQQRVVLLFDLDPAVDAQAAERAVQACVRSVSVLAPEEKKTADTKFQNRKVQGTVDRADPELRAARDRVIQNIRNLKGWWFVETPNYVITSNLGSGNRRLVDMIQTDIESLRTVFTKALPPLKPIVDVSVVRVFNSAAEFKAYVPPEISWATGLWMPEKDELVVSPVDVRQAGAAGRFLLMTVYHEAFHQYAHYALNRMFIPVWFDEGHATFFAAGDVDAHRKRIVFPEDETLARRLVTLLKADKTFSLAPYLAMNHRRFYGDGREGHYAVVWGLVYFLRKAAAQYPGRNYDRVCADVVRRLAALGLADERQAIQAAAASVEVLRLNRDFRDFWESSAKRKRAERVDPFAED